MGTNLSVTHPQSCIIHVGTFRNPGGLRSIPEMSRYCMLKQFTLWSLNYKNTDHFAAHVLHSIPYLTVWTCISCPPSSLYAMTAHTSQTIKNLVVSSWPSGNSSLRQMSVQRDKYIFFYFFLPAWCEISAHRSATFFSIWSNIVVEKYKYLLAPLQVFVSQLQMSHGPVPKSGPKLLQMFSNDRLQCQHKPTSTFVYYIFLFDVVQMNFTASQTHSGARWESTSR